MKEQLDAAFEIFMRGMEMVDRAIGDRIGNEPEPKEDHPSTFRVSLQESEDADGDQHKRA